ncbi:MAG: T9SS type A sorting domain-containing protein, partial [Flammeovirgaceae bacterium]|nr:T9SS type A sorting domain-containing protein [Flammeovirgaceae bacterium]
LFKDESDAGISNITHYTWDFGEMPFAPIRDTVDASVPGGTHSGNTSGTFMEPKHRYGNFGLYNVKLTIETDDGCQNSVTRRAYILDYGQPTPTAGYFTNYESGQGTWFASLTEDGITANPSSDSSWVFGAPYGNIIKDTLNHGNVWWTGKNYGSNEGSYYDNEKSIIIGPCLNLTAIERPMIALDYWVDAENNLDGAAVQFSVNGGADWLTIGTNNGDGINWYNGQGINGKPGDQDIGQYGWTGKSVGWKNARYNLDQVREAVGPGNDTLVVFRIAFGSNFENQINTNFNGFAFDNIYIGEKNKNVLVEYYTNTSLSTTGVDDYLNDLFQDQFLFKFESDFNKIEYHIANPVADVLNDDNPIDPATRAQYYGITQAPKAVMDGILGDYGAVPGGFTGNQLKITPEELDRRSLEDPQFNIVGAITPTGDSTMINVTYDFIYIDTLADLKSPVALQVALVEDSVTVGSALYRNVLRKLLLEPQGLSVEILPNGWTNGVTRTVNINNKIDVPIQDPTKLSLIAFIQDINTKRIYQSSIIKAPALKGIIVTSAEGELQLLANQVEVYPNPAADKINLSIGENAYQRYSYKFVDQRGVDVLSGGFTDTQEVVDISGLANGLYFVRISYNNQNLVYRKVMVIN